MSQPRFLADENIEAAIVSATRRIEPALEFHTLQELGLLGATDETILHFAPEHSLIVVSHDVNTMIGAAKLRVAQSEGMAGLFIVGQPAIPRKIAESLAIVWGASIGEEWRDCIVFLPF